MVLQRLRDRLSGIMAIFIVGLLAVPFALVGVNSYFAPDVENTVAIVNDEGITLTQFSNSFQNYRSRMQSLMGEAYDPARFDGPLVRRQHLDTMIDRELLRQVAVETGLSVDDQFLAQAIRDIPGFQVDGEFNPEVYQSHLSGRGLTSQQFENQMRASMVLGQYPRSISASAIATPAEVDRYIRLQEQERAFGALLVDAEIESEDSPEISEERIQEWYETHGDEYRYPERVIVEYVELNAAEMGTDEEIDEAALRQRFEEQSGRFITPESRLASHILIEVDPTADEAEIETARERAQALYERAKEGEDFAELAREHSQDQGSAASGGDLDWVEPGVMVEAFENALYELTMESPISEPVQTGFGWHVIKLRDIRPAEGMSFEEARETLASEFIAERTERQFIEKADRLVDIIYEDPTTLEAAADELDLEIKVAGPFDRGGTEEGIASNSEFVETAFSDLVLLQESASDPVDLGPNHMAVLRVREHLPEAPKPLEEVRDEVIAAIRRDEAMKAAGARAMAMLERLKGGEPLEALAEETGLELLESEGATRRAPEVPADFRRELFELPAPAEGEVNREVLELEDGYAVVELREVRPGSLTDEEEARREAYRRRLANVTASTESQAFLRMLRAQSKIQVFEDRL